MENTIIHIMCKCDVCKNNKWDENGYFMHGSSINHLPLHCDYLWSVYNKITQFQEPVLNDDGSIFYEPDEEDLKEDDIKEDDGTDVFSFHYGVSAGNHVGNIFLLNKKSKFYQEVIEDSEKDNGCVLHAQSLIEINVHDRVDITTWMANLTKMFDQIEIQCVYQKYDPKDLETDNDQIYQQKFDFHLLNYTQGELNYETRFKIGEKEAGTTFLMTGSTDTNLQEYIYKNFFPRSRF